MTINRLARYNGTIGNVSSKGLSNSKGRIRRVKTVEGRDPETGKFIRAKDLDGLRICIKIRFTESQKLESTTTNLLRAWHGFLRAGLCQIPI